MLKAWISLFLFYEVDAPTPSIFYVAAAFYLGVDEMRRPKVEIRMPTHLAKNRPSLRQRFVVHQTEQGYWLASEQGGLITGVFAIQRDALRFALAHVHRRIDDGQNAQEIR